MKLRSEWLRDNWLFSSLLSQTLPPLSSLTATVSKDTTRRQEPALMTLLPRTLGSSPRSQGRYKDEKVRMRWGATGRPSC